MIFNYIISVDMHKYAGGKLIVFEGGDRSGKTTQSHLLHESIPDSVLLRYPDRNAPIGQILNSFLSGQTQLLPSVSNLLFLAILWQTVEEIKKHLTEGRTVILDRYTASCYVYSLLRGIDEEQLKVLLAGMPEPSITFFLDVDPQRTAKRGDFGHEIYDTVEYQQRVRQEFLICPKDPSWVTIEASESIEEIHRQILSEIYN